MNLIKKALCNTAALAIINYKINSEIGEINEIIITVNTSEIEWEDVLI